MKRRRRTRVQRVAIFDRDKGICHRCGIKIHAERGEKWELGHIIGLGVGGTDDDDNLAPEHVSCNRESNRVDETPRAAKIKRVRAKHLGVKKKLAFKGWRRFDGSIVWKD